MELTKYDHACVTLAKPDGGLLLIDPGAFTAAAEDLLSRADAVLLTHEHEDHVHPTAITAALDARPDLVVYGPAAVVERWKEHGDRAKAVGEGDAFEAAGFSIAASGELHAVIHPDIPQCANVGFLVDGSVFHPGDSYDAPKVPIATLLMPTSGPWASVRQGVDFVRAVAPQQAIQIHEALLSELGQQFTTHMLSSSGLGPSPVRVVPVGESIEV